MTKVTYLYELLRLKKYMKLSIFAKEAGISQSNLSHFMGGRLDIISLNKLELMFQKMRSVI